jgi:Multicopper oxidase
LAVRLFETCGEENECAAPSRRDESAPFEANNPGLWAFHRHLLYHPAAGMFTTFRYV